MALFRSHFLRIRRHRETDNEIGLRNKNEKMKTATRRKLAGVRVELELESLVFLDSVKEEARRVGGKKKVIRDKNIIVCCVCLSVSVSTFIAFLTSRFLLLAHLAIMIMIMIL